MFFNELEPILPAKPTYKPDKAAAIRAGKSSRELKPRGILKLVFRLIMPLFKSSPARIDHLLSGGEEFAFLGGLKAISTPGHTPGHISFYSASRKVLFAGDSIQISAGKPAPSAGANTWNLDQAQASFQLQMALDPGFILAGHGIWKKNQSTGVFSHAPSS